MIACLVWMVGGGLAVLVLLAVVTVGFVLAAHALEDPAGMDDLGRERVGL